MEEVWRDIPGIVGYQVSKSGFLRSVDRTVKRKDGKIAHLKGKPLSTYTDKNGYERISLPVGLKTIHRLVGLAFPEICGEYFEGAEIDHINTIRNDNRAENLRWVKKTDQYKNETTRKHLYNTVWKKGHLKNRKDLSKWVIKLSGNNEILHFYPSVSEASRQTGVPTSNIIICCQNKPGHKTAGGYIWKYAE